MDPQLMQSVLKQVLGEGYEPPAESAPRTSGSPSPHDFFQGRVSKMGMGEGGDMHVPQGMGTQKPRTQTSRPRGSRGTLRAIPVDNSAGSVGKSFLNPTQQGSAKLGQHLTAAGALGGALSLPSLAQHTTDKLREGGVLKPKAKLALPPMVAKPEAAVKGIKGALKPIADVMKKPKVAAGLAAGAAGLEVAGLGGDFVAHHNLKNQVQKSEEGEITFSKVDDEKRQVFGWCSLSKKDGQDVVDLQGDMVPIEEIEKSAYDYMLMSRMAGNQHARVSKNYGPVHVGNVIESMVFTPEKIEKMGLPSDFPQGWWIGMHIHDDETWRQIKSGERAGFSIHGQGKREAVAKAENPVKPGYERVVDRKEQIKDIALGGAGATSAGAGIGAALAPKHAEKFKPGDLSAAAKAEKLSGRLKIVGAAVGGTAGVYGGIHAMHQAAINAPTRKVPARINKVWSPVVQHDSPEGQRQKRAAVYQHAAEGVSATGAATSVGALGARRSLRGLASRADSAAASHLRQHHVALAAGAEHKAGAEAYVAPDLRSAKANYQAERIKQKGSMAPEGSNEMKQVARLHAQQVKAKAFHQGKWKEAQGAASFHLKAAKDFHSLGEHHLAGAARAGKVARRGGLVALGGAAAAGAIHHQRKNSWSSYNGM